MSSIVSTSNLIFFKAEQYHFDHDHIIDFSNSPRPHYCLGLVICGQGTFSSCDEEETVHVTPGDIIFVPMGSRYISHWTKDPDVAYLSIHFIFNTPGVFAKENTYKLQKVSPDNFEQTEETFRFVLEHYNDDEVHQLKMLGKFYNLLSSLLPHLQKKQSAQMNPKIVKTINFIQNNYKKKITVEMLSTNIQMSVSRFFPFFKEELGITPVDYINNYRISQAIIILMNETDRSVEDISEETGFESSAYFRRVFKKVTGLSPREYRKTSMEI